MQRIGKYGKLGRGLISGVSPVRLKLIPDSLYYGRMYFPSSKLEGMHIRRVSPAWQYILSFVSDQRPGRGSAVRIPR